jgi:hypothetical protein
MAEGTEVHAEESAHSAGDKTTAKGKAGSFVEKHKALVYGGAGLALVIIWFLLRGSSSSNSAATQAATSAAQQQAADQAALASEPSASGGGDDGGGGSSGGWTPTSTAAAGGSGSVASTPTTPASSPLTGYTAITFAQAEKLAGKGGSSSLYYGTTSGAILQGKYANDKNVQYYTKTPTGTTT